MTIAEIKVLPVQEKLQIMEAIWEDFSERFDRMEIPEAHKELLDRRRARVESGEARLLDWNAVRSTIGRA